MGPVGVPEMIAIFLVALLLFGPKKLPELGRTLAKAITEFRRATNELKATFESHMSELERETQALKEPATTTYQSSDYSSSYPYEQDEYHHYDSDQQQTSAALEATVAEPITAGATAPQDAQAHQNEQPAAPAHIAGTVAHSTNLPEPGSGVPTEEAHSA